MRARSLAAVAATATALAISVLGCNEVLGVGTPQRDHAAPDGGVPAVGSGATTGGGGSGGAVEDCFNGLDDDGDGAIDCDDPSCADATRAPAPPSDWKLGEIVIAGATAIDDPATPACDSGFALLHKGGAIDVPALGCAACTYDATCSAHGGQVVAMPPIHFDPTYAMCPAANVGVSGPHGACMPKVSTNARACIFHVMNDVAPCPSGFPVKVEAAVFTGVVNDVRSCSPCACDASCAPTGGTSEGGVDTDASVTMWVACCVE